MLAEVTNPIFINLSNTNLNSSTTLYFYQDSEIKISIDAYFDGGELVIDGYDIGTKVEEYWGDSDYEYITRIPAAGVVMLYNHFNIPQNNQEQLLQKLAATFNTNTCYSDIGRLLKQLNISSTGFSWT